MYADFDKERYRERNKVETAFSVLKRRFGEELKARKYWYPGQGDQEQGDSP
jgi:hypothetical protein